MFTMHYVIEESFHVRIGYPFVEGRRKLRIIGPKERVKPTLDFIGSIADGEVTRPPTSPMKPRQHNVPRNKVFYCWYCRKGLKTKVIDHCMAVHADEALVQKIMGLPAKDPERKFHIQVSMNVPVYITNLLL